MNALLTWAAATPIPTPTMTVDPNDVTPGFVGFAWMGIVVIAVVLLLTDMLRRIRRGRYRAEVSEQLDAEEALAQEQAEAAERASNVDDQSIDAGETPDAERRL